VSSFRGSSCAAMGVQLHSELVCPAATARACWVGCWRAFAQDPGCLVLPRDGVTSPRGADFQSFFSRENLILTPLLKALESPTWCRNQAQKVVSWCSLNSPKK